MVSQNLGIPWPNGHEIRSWVPTSAPPWATFDPRLPHQPEIPKSRMPSMTENAARCTMKIFLKK